MTLDAVGTYGRSGGSIRVRIHRWIERLGVDARVHTYLGTSTVGLDVIGRHPVGVVRAERELRRLAASRPDTLVVHREASPLSGGRLEHALLRSARRGIYDFDDGLQWDWGDVAGRLRRLRPKAPKTIAAVRAADVVIAGNAVLADWATAYARHVVVVPSCVEPADYRLKTTYAVHDPPVIGWVGSAATEAYLRLIEAPLLEVHRRTGARVALLGSSSGSLGALDAVVDRRPWSEAAAHDIATKWDLGVMPLSDGLLERSKCGYKLLEYGAAALPCIGSPVGANTEILEHFGAPAPVTSDDWLEALTALLGAPADERARLGGRARAAVAANWSYAGWAEDWRAAVGI